MRPIIGWHGLSDWTRPEFITEVIDEMNDDIPVYDDETDDYDGWIEKHPHPTPGLLDRLLEKLERAKEDDRFMND